MHICPKTFTWKNPAQLETCPKAPEAEYVKSREMLFLVSFFASFCGAFSIPALQNPRSLGCEKIRASSHGIF